MSKGDLVDEVSLYFQKALSKICHLVLLRKLNYCSVRGKVPA